jgi:mono/diheme cytochrome c family protein
VSNMPSFFAKFPTSIYEPNGTTRGVAHGIAARAKTPCMSAVLFCAVDEIETEPQRRRAKSWPEFRAGLGAIASFVLSAAIGLPAHSQQPLEALRRGEHIAQLVCSACHVVAQDQEFPPILRPPAPSFEEIANRPNMSLQTVQQFVLQTHWDMKTLPMQMPAQMLRKSDTTAVARYVLSLRKR